MTHGLSHVPRKAIRYFAIGLVLALAAGGGYAAAASNNKTITVCADKTTGVLHLKTRGRCKNSQTRVSWNQQGPRGIAGPQGAIGVTGAQGPAGRQGPPGAQGPAGVSVWADVAGNGVVVAGQGLSVQRLSAGTYQVTVTDPACSGEVNAPVVSLSDSNPPEEGANAGPATWYEATGTNEQFKVFTGFVSGTPIAFTASDHTFDVLDACQSG